MRIASALSVIGRRLADEELKASCRISETDLKRVRDTELGQICSRIAGHATRFGTALAEYGVGRPDIDALDAAVKEYERLLGLKEVKQANSKASRDALYEAFDKADDILKNDLDQLMELVRESHPDFYN